MLKVSLAALSIVTILAAASVFSDGIRAQGTAQIEYLRVTPFGVSVQAGLRVSVHEGYRACRAAVTAWTCRVFQPAPSNDALRTVLATLGSEGWELVSAIKDEPGSGD